MKAGLGPSSPAARVLASAVVAQPSRHAARTGRRKRSCCSAMQDEMQRTLEHLCGLREALARAVFLGLHGAWRSQRARDAGQLRRASSDRSRPHTPADPGRGPHGQPRIRRPPLRGQPGSDVPADDRNDCPSRTTTMRCAPSSGRLTDKSYKSALERLVAQDGLPGFQQHHWTYCPTCPKTRSHSFRDNAPLPHPSSASSWERHIRDVVRGVPRASRQSRSSSIDLSSGGPSTSTSWTARGAATSSRATGSSCA